MIYTLTGQNPVNVVANYGTRQALHRGETLELTFVGVVPVDDPARAPSVRVGEHLRSDTDPAEVPAAVIEAPHVEPDTDTADTIRLFLDAFARQE